MGTTVLYMDTPESTSRGIAEAVKVALSTAGISRRDAAAQTGIPLTTLQRRLTGSSPFLVTEIAALAHLTGTTVSALVAHAEQDVAS